MNELAALSMDGYSMAAGGVLVQVPENYAAEARALIQSADNSSEPPSSGKPGP
jgi:hypothetical protein